MGCLFALLAGFFPRIALLLLWIFTTLVDRAFDGFILPLLGLILLPYATLFYVLAWSPVVGVTGWGWFFVIVGIFFDVSHWTSTAYTQRQRHGAA